MDPTVGQEDEEATCTMLENYTCFYCIYLIYLNMFFVSLIIICHFGFLFTD